MRRPELEHVIRAAATVAEDEELIVIGSQAVLGQFPEAPETLLTSREVDIYPRNRPERAIEIEGSLGDSSYFDSTYGYHAHAVGPETATLPDWEFVEEAVRHRLAEPAQLRRRLVDLPVSESRRAEVGRTVDGVIARAESKGSG